MKSSSILLRLLTGCVAMAGLLVCPNLTLQPVSTLCMPIYAQDGEAFITRRLDAHSSIVVRHQDRPLLTIVRVVRSSKTVYSERFDTYFGRVSLMKMGKSNQAVLSMGEGNTFRIVVLNYSPKYPKKVLDRFLPKGSANIIPDGFDLYFSKSSRNSNIDSRYCERLLWNGRSYVTSNRIRLNYKI